MRVVNYVNSLSDLLSNGIVNTITDLCNLIFIILFMLFCDARLTLICLCGLPLLTAVVILIKKKQHRAWQIQSNKQSNLNAYIAESINGIRVTQSFVREQENTGIFNGLSRGYRKSWMHAIKFNFIMGPSVDMISAITTAFVYVLGIRWILAPDATADSRCSDRLYGLYRKILGPHQYPGGVLQLPAYGHLLPGAYL